MLMIVIHHVFLLWGAKNHITTSWGFLGTGMFFLLSGYGLYVSLENKKLEFSWIVQKSKKMLFPFTFAFFVYIILLPFYNYEGLSCSLIVDFFTLRIPNTTTWFLKAILLLYFITYIAFSKLQKKWRVYFVLLCVVSFFLFARIFLSAEWYWTILNFPMGMFMGLYRKKIETKKFAFKMAGLLSLVFFIISLERQCNVAASMFFSILATVGLSFFPVKNYILNYIGINSINFYLFQMIFLHVCLAVPLCTNVSIYLVFVILLTFSLSLIYNKIQKMV